MTRVHSPTISDAELKAAGASLPGVEAKLDDVLSNLSPRMQETDARLAQLGPSPSATQPPEDAEIGELRRRVLAFREALDTEIKQARLLDIEVDQTAHFITQRRQKLFATLLWRRTPSLLSPALWSDLKIAAPGDVARMARFVNGEQGRLNSVSTDRLRLILLALLGIAGLLILGPLRRLFRRIVLDHLLKLGPDAALRSSGVAVWRTLCIAGSVWAAALFLQNGLIWLQATTPAANEIVRAAAAAATFGALIAGLGGALISASDRIGRIAPLSDTQAKNSAASPGLIGAAAALSSLAARVAEILGVSRPTSDAIRDLALTITLVALVFALLALSRTRAPPASAPIDEATGGKRFWVASVIAAWVAALGAFVCLVFGYAALADFVIHETVWIGLILAVLSLLLRFAEAAITALVSPSGAPGRRATRLAGIAPTTLEQGGVLLSGVLRLTLFLLAWAAILAPFGAGAEDAISRVSASDLVIRLGQVSISPGAVAGAAAVFALGLAATKVVRRWLQETYLPKTAMDAGVQVSVASGVSYLGALAAIILTSAYLGLSLDRIALLASALSVGIGFGLQAIIGNFVSGLILLAERPVRVGDWIAIGDLEGDVRRISVRATEIEMRDRSKLIVPNSDLISKTVRNITHSGAIGRVKIVFRLDDSADPLLVRELITECLTSHGDVLLDPTPALFMNDIRDGGLEFTAFAYIASARDAYRVKSELLFTIVPALRSRQLVFASSSPVLKVEMADRLMEPPPAT